MVNKDKLAEQRRVYRQLPECLVPASSLFFAWCRWQFCAPLRLGRKIRHNTGLNNAEELTHNGSIEEAISAYDEALKIEPEKTTILIRKASDLNVMDRANESLETYQTALGLLDQELKENQSDAEAWQNKAGVLRSLNRQNEYIQSYEKALEAYEGRIEKNPEDVEARLGKAHVLIPANNTAETAELMFAWADKTEELAAADRWEDALQKALELFDEAISASPDDISLLQSGGLTLYELGRYEDALAVYDGIPRRSPSIAPYLAHTNAQIGKRDALYSMGRYGEAISAWDRAIELDPKFAAAWKVKGDALRALGRNSEADAAYAKAEELGYRHNTTTEERP